MALVGYLGGENTLIKLVVVRNGNRPYDIPLPGQLVTYAVRKIDTSTSTIEVEIRKSLPWESHTIRVEGFAKTDEGIRRVIGYCIVGDSDESELGVLEIQDI